MLPTRRGAGIPQTRLLALSTVAPGGNRTLPGCVPRIAACASSATLWGPLGDSMGASAALRFARHATPDGSVLAFVPQVELDDFVPCDREDFTPEYKAAFRQAVLDACAETRATVAVHVGYSPYDVRQAEVLMEHKEIELFQHDVDGHLVSAELKARGVLDDIVRTAVMG
eukprot:TRINITY_DN25879_c0_g1_i1.p3 TRINITY_DN25879_c0_g1~~TRINITY_DN25879_c0_g1_i1.p3  ORF type:complete len:170 (+),score=23.41 TRINITY_DN25879_c0_g1_i1:483-992(+)